jgi:hypothetical protein
MGVERTGNDGWHLEVSIAHVPASIGVIGGPTMDDVSVDDMRKICAYAFATALLFDTDWAPHPEYEEIETLSLDGVLVLRGGDANFRSLLFQKAIECLMSGEISPAFGGALGGRYDLAVMPTSRADA